VKLPFLNRTEELTRLGKAFSAPESTFVCLYGRRRCGKSRLLQQALKGRKGVYFVGDEREAALQRASLTKEISRLLPGFDRVTYHSWDDLFERWYTDAPSGAILALDEFPFLCAASSALPGILQKIVDKERYKPVHLAVCGSSENDVRLGT
jgi:AAA+ ATPase superfamily predicted ATPase